MRRLIQGVQKFQNEVVRARAEFFAGLAHGQHPETLFITCSDSRVDPNLITQTGPGDLFILRNIGNIVPPVGTATDSEEAVIEYAVVALGVKDIVVCGHSHCGAMKGLLQPEALGSLPAVASWLTHAEETRQAVAEKFSHLRGDELIDAAVRENVLVQLEHLRSLSSVANRLAKGDLQLHGWVYHVESGKVLIHDPDAGDFVPAEGARLPSSRPGSTTA